MSSSKKRKIVDRRRLFQKEWTDMFFFIEEAGKPCCLKCKRSIAVMKKENLKRHYETNHPELKNLDGELRKMKIDEFKKGLNAQQSLMTSFCSTNEDVLTVSYEVSELIAKKLKPYDDGAWAKELLVKAAEKLAPKSVHMYQKLSLSRPTVCERIKEMGQDIEDNLRKRAEKFVSFSVCLDETTDIKNTAQMAIFFRGVTSDFQIDENLLSLESMHETTRGEDLLQKLLQALGKFNLPLDKLCGVATDGAPAMVGKHKGMVSLLKKEMDARGIRHDGLVFFHCIVHQQSLCAKSVKFDNVISVVTNCINFIKKRDLNNRIFKQVLNDFDADYDDLLYFCAVRWTSCGNMLGRFHSLLPQIIEFINLKKCPLTELEDENWLCDLAFMVDITKYLNDLNVQLQGPDQLLHSMFSKIKSFTSMLRLWENQLKDNDCTHFPTLKKYSPTSCAQYALECSSLLKSFNARFQDIKSKQMELDIFSIPFNVTPASAPPELQIELIKPQSDDMLKAMYLSKPLLEFYRVYVSNEEFPNLRARALKWSSVFGSTYLCEQFFSKMNFTKSRYRSRLTDENLGMQLRVATSSVLPNIKRLVKQKSFQTSH